MSHFTTQYMESYRSPHESPTGLGGVDVRLAVLKAENRKLRDENKKIKKESKSQAETITRLRQQLSYIKKAATLRPPKLDLN